jgi:biopolymer transport protein TolQ
VGHSGLTGQQGDLFAMVTGSGLVVQFVLYVLILFSVVSWGIILYKVRQVRVARRTSDRFLTLFWESKNLTSVHAASESMLQSPVAEVFRAGYEELVRLTRAKRQAKSEEGLTTELGGVANVERAMRRATSQQITIGLGVTQTSSIQAVAPGISEALIATATGLFAAIPAVVAYNHFARQIRVLSAEMDNFAFEFLNIAERHFLK